MDAYETHKDPGRVHGYRRVINIVKGIPYKITSVHQIKNIKDVKGISKKMQGKLIEIL